jgi:hypothetical protein
LRESVGAQTIDTSGKPLTNVGALVWTVKAPTTIAEWKAAMGWTAVTFADSAPDEIKVCVDQSNARCFTLGELRALKPKGAK